MTTRCTQCDHSPLDPGTVADLGRYSQGFLSWIQGPLERGLFGGGKVRGRAKWAVEAYRCDRCGHLELFTSQAR